ncbi:hypothetical protein ACFVT2_21190 [Streptomyces sp. NPDC058000]|uniref:hypothetical protein n=1 Tax=Streptomyces sp. NPDC058000 TaxID=3346299 RepID=UPI0036EFFF58
MLTVVALYRNGYRDCDVAAEQTIRQICALPAAGLTTTLIRQVLPCGLADGATG